MKIFKTKCLPREWVKRTHNHWYFKMHSSRRTVLIGIRKVGRGIGNLYWPFNEYPFKVLAGGKRNTSNFQNVESHKVCFSCGYFTHRQCYGAWKITEYCRNLKSTTR